jgi:hypothetical protein
MTPFGEPPAADYMTLIIIRYPLMRALIAAMVGLLCATTLSAQPASSTLVVDLTDATGSALPGVAISVVNQATRVERIASY